MKKSKISVTSNEDTLNENGMNEVINEMVENLENFEMNEPVESIPEPEESPNVPIMEFLELKKMVALLSESLQTMQSENEQLKNRKVLTLAEAQKISDRKKQIENDLTRFNEVNKQLCGVSKLLHEESFDGSFVVTLTNNYGNKIASFSNYEVVKVFISFLSEKIDTKCFDLECELIEINKL